MSEDKAARQREATARYRKAHADRIEKARAVMNLLLRQRVAHGDIKVLAAALAGLLTPEGVNELRRELPGGGRRKRRTLAPAASPEEETKRRVVALIEEIYQFDTGFPERVQAFLEANTPTEDGLAHLRNVIFKLSENLLALSNEVVAER